MLPGRHHADLHESVCQVLLHPLDAEQGVEEREEVGLHGVVTLGQEPQQSQCALEHLLHRLVLELETHSRRDGA